MADDIEAQLQRERDAELEAEVRLIHVPMKKWYVADSPTELRKRCGDFPAFWQDLRSWKHLAEVKKLYHRRSEQLPATVTSSTVVSAAAE